MSAKELKTAGKVLDLMPALRSALVVCTVCKRQKPPVGRDVAPARSIEHYEEWAWLLGDDDLMTKLESAPYAPYGAPKLRVIAEYLGIDANPDGDGEWNNMLAGNSCHLRCAECRS